MSKVRFKDLPDGACFKPRVKSNPGKKIARDLLIWHGNSTADRVFEGKPKKNRVTTDTLVIPTRCPGARPAQPTKVRIKCGHLKRRYRALEDDVRRERYKGAAADTDEIRDLRESMDRIMFDALDLDCGWTDDI